jgi:hypothetical protein
MHKTKEVIRHKSVGLALHVIASADGLSLGTVSNYTKVAEQAGLGWPLPSPNHPIILSSILLDEQLGCRLEVGRIGCEKFTT